MKLLLTVLRPLCETTGAAKWHKHGSSKADRVYRDPRKRGSFASVARLGQPDAFSLMGDKGGNCWQRLPIKACHCLCQLAELFRLLFFSLLFSPSPFLSASLCARLPSSSSIVHLTLRPSAGPESSFHLHPLQSVLSILSSSFRPVAPATFS